MEISSVTLSEAEVCSAIQTYLQARLKTAVSVKAFQQAKAKHDGLRIFMATVEGVDARSYPIAEEG